MIEQQPSTNGAAPVERIRVDMNELTLDELARAGEALGATLDVALSGPGQPRAVAALAWLIRQRDDPTYTYEQALQLRAVDVDLVGEDGASNPEPSGDNTGDAPLLSPALGDSARSTS